jgi:tRNA(Leu) C34 or U34 (ribose-2'-O)-methylase TrmL
MDIDATVDALMLAMESRGLPQNILADARQELLILIPNKIYTITDADIV